MKQSGTLTGDCEQRPALSQFEIYVATQVEISNVKGIIGSRCFEKQNFMPDKERI